jgi:hypothetical protein
VLSWKQTKAASSSGHKSRGCQLVSESTIAMSGTFLCGTPHSSTPPCPDCHILGTGVVGYFELIFLGKSPRNNPVCLVVALPAHPSLHSFRELARTDSHFEPDSHRNRLPTDILSMSAVFRRAFTFYFWHIVAPLLRCSKAHKPIHGTHLGFLNARQNGIEATHLSSSPLFAFPFNQLTSQ